MDSSREKLLGLFFQEVIDYIPDIREHLSKLQSGQPVAESMQELHRLFHNIKGAASQLYLERLSSTACIAELISENIIDTAESPSQNILRFLGDVSSAIHGYCLNGKRDNQLEEQLYRNAVDACENIQEITQSENWPKIRANLLTQGKQVEKSTPVFTESNKDTISVKKINQDTIRSIIQLLSQLNEVHAKQNQTDISDEVVPEIQRVLQILKQSISSIEFSEQQRFLEEFDKLLGKVSATASHVDLGLPQLIGDFLTCLEMIFTPPYNIGPEVVDRIVSKMGRVTDLLGGEKKRAVEGKLLFQDNVDDPLDTFFNDESGVLTEIDDEFDSATGEEGVLPKGEDIAESSLFDESEDIGVIFDDVVDEDELFDEPDFAGESIFGDQELNENFADESVEVDDDDELFSLEEIFQSECEEHLITINIALQVLEKDGQQDQIIDSSLREALKEMRRAVHTLKGAAAMTGFAPLSSFAHHFEDLLDYLYEKVDHLTPDAVTLMTSAINSIEVMSQDAHSDIGEQTAFVEEAILAFLASNSDKLHEGAIPSERVAEPVIEATAGIQESIDNIRIRTDRLDELVNLEGDLVIARNAMTGLLDELNQTVGELETAKEKLRKISGDLEAGFETQALHGFGSGGTLPGPSASPVQGIENDDFDVMELDRYSELNLIIRSLNEMSIDVNSIHSGITQISGDLRGQLASQEITMRMMQDRFMRIRMSPMSSISRMFFRAVRDTSAKLGKKARLIVEGEDVYLDRFVWTKISDPMMHLLRNCVDHGIEAEEHRIAIGKADVATVKVAAQQRGNMVVLRISDDGGGVDVDKLRQKVIESGLIEREESIKESELLSYLFHTGISTRDEISEISGRGVGLDVVHKNIYDLGGTILVHTKRGEGTTFELNIPISLSVNRAIIVKAGEDQYAVPLHNIREIRGVGADENENRDGLMWQGEIVRKKHLSQLMLKSLVTTDPDEDDKGYVIIVPTESGHSAIVVDGIAGQQEIVVKTLGSQLQNVHGISGVTDFGDGHLIPILNLSELAEDVPARVKSVVEDVDVIEHDPTIHVLVVDDSISVRQSILRLMKSQNWVTELAKDGVDALDKLEKFMPDIIVSDIEMPRMNGYEFKEMLNSNERCKNIPVLMLTSRISEKHQSRAKELGVCEYVIKPYREEDFVSLIKKHTTQLSQFVEMS